MANWSVKDKSEKNKKTKCCTDNSCDGCEMYDICNPLDEDKEDKVYISEPFNVTITFDKYLEHPDIITNIADNVTNRPVFINIC